VLRYKEGLSFHTRIDEDIFLSHIGMHVNEIPDIDAPVIQHVFTKSHTNSYLHEKRRSYEYKIFNTRGIYGFDTKFIRRIEDSPIYGASS
jgi:hypothetical protein